MSWIRNLIKTYDFCESLIGKIDTSAGKTNGSVVLLPLFHLVNNASLEIYIDQDGNFIRAERIPKYDQADYSRVIAPVVADLCTTPVALSAPPNSFQNNSQS